MGHVGKKVSGQTIWWKAHLLMVLKEKIVKETFVIANRTKTTKIKNLKSLLKWLT